MLADVVSKGGNLLLNIGPGPDGTWHDEAYDRPGELGDWLDVNGRAIYATRQMAPHSEGKVRLTRGRDGEVYAIYLADEGENEIPRYLTMTQLRPADGATVSLLGVPGDLTWKGAGTGFIVEVPDSLRSDPPSRYAWTIVISEVRR